MPLTSNRSGNPTAVVAMQALLGSLRYSQLLPRNLGSAADAPHFRAFAAASAQLTSIKALRERTSAPISDVKSALVEASWNEGGRLSAALAPQCLINAMVPDYTAHVGDLSIH